MKKNLSILLFSMLMIMGTLITLSSNNWIMMWMGLEMNMISFLPLIQSFKSTKSSEASMIYFLIQSLGSMMLMFSVTVQNPIMMITKMAILIKMGGAPTHFWMVEIMEKMPWMNCLILMTWQKLAPMIMMMQMSKLMELAMISIMVGAIGGLNQISMRKMMAFSSINHMGWMMATMEIKTLSLIKYLIIYTILMVMLILTLNQKSIMYMNQMNENLSKMQKINISVMMMSMGGLPPFLGFSAKWIIIQEMISAKMNLMVTMMIMFSMITLFFYLRMISTLMMMESYSMKINIKTDTQKSELYMMMMNMFMLPMSALMLI